MTSEEPCMSTSFEESCELMEEQLEGKTVGTSSVSCFLLLFVCCCFFFFNCTVLLCCLVLLVVVVVVVFVFEAVLVDVAAVVVLPEGAIFLRQRRQKLILEGFGLKEVVKSGINWHVQKLATTRY